MSKVTMADALAAGDGVILNVQAARIEELEAQRDELLEAFEKLVSLIDAGEGTWTLEEQQKARTAIAKARGKEMLNTPEGS